MYGYKATLLLCCHLTDNTTSRQITFDRPPHAVLHLGMTGWMKFNVEDTAYYKQAKETEVKEQEWPPRFMKFLWKSEAEKVDGVDKDTVEVAFVDPRRLGRIRLVECEADDIRNQSPLKENGPDPVRDKEIVTVEWLTELTQRKKVPIKALLLDQANLSGVGNWVADEVLYQARIHPEQYCNTLNDDQLPALHKALMEVCTTAVETLGDSKQFPGHWIMKYRWDKGKKDSNILPNGEKIVHITVGGRTSAIVPSVQKKTGAVAGDIDEDDSEQKPAKGKKRKSVTEAEDGEKATKKGRVKKNAQSNGVKEEAEEKQLNGGADGDDEKPPKSAKGKKAMPNKEAKPPTPGSRRSTRTKT